MYFVSLSFCFLFCIFVLIEFLAVDSSELSKDLSADLFDPEIGTESGSIHVVIPTDCHHSYFFYQVLALNYTFHKVQQQGKLTRLISCNEVDTQLKLKTEELEMVDSLVVPDWSRHPTSRDSYPLYNHPVSLIYWLKRRKPTAEWTLILQAETLFQQAITISDFNLPHSFAAASYNRYLTGAVNELAGRYLPGGKRGDEYGGLGGRQADQSDGFLFIRTRDLIKVVPLWLELTEELRADPVAWNLTGDGYQPSQGKPWLAVKYGYLFAAAKIGLWHKVDPVMLAFPGHPVKDVPSLVYYGLSQTQGILSSEKQQFPDLDPFLCSPWSPVDGGEIQGGLVPLPSSLDFSSKSDIQQRYGELLEIEFLLIINKALCLRYELECSPSQELSDACQPVYEMERKLDEEFSRLQQNESLCEDESKKCKLWVEDGDCERKWLTMVSACRQSCGKCKIAHHVRSSSKQKHQVWLGSNKTKAAERDKQKEDEKANIRCLVLGDRGPLVGVDCKTMMKTNSLIAQNQSSHKLSFEDRVLYFKFGFFFACVLIFVALFFRILVLILQRNKKRKRNMKSKTKAAKYFV